MSIRELTDHVAKRAAAIPERVRKQFAPDQQVELRLTGKDGGIFTLWWENGSFMVKETRASTPVASVEAPVKAVLDLFTGRYGSFFDLRNGGPPVPLAFDLAALLAPEKVSLVKQLTGTMCVQCCEGSAPGDDFFFEAFISFNGEPFDKDEPRCVVNLPLGSVERIARGEIAPPQLLFSGGMRVTGDLQMVMQMLPLLR